mgnify:CR=1 FL=1
MLRLLPEAGPGLHHLVVCGATRALASHMHDQGGLVAGAGLPRGHGSQVDQVDVAVQLLAQRRVVRGQRVPGVAHRLVDQSKQYLKV